MLISAFRGFITAGSTMLGLNREQIEDERRSLIAGAEYIESIEKCLSELSSAVQAGEVPRAPCEELRLRLTFLAKSIGVELPDDWESADINSREIWTSIFAGHVNRHSPEIRLFELLFVAHMTPSPYTSIFSMLIHSGRPDFQDFWLSENRGWRRDEALIHSEEARAWCRARAAELRLAAGNL